MKKLVALFLTLVMAISLTPPALAADWTAPYEEPVKATFGLDASGWQFPEGEAIDNNYLTAWIQEAFNIEFESAWETTELTTRVNLAMTDGEFPDFFLVSGTTAKQQIRQLIDAGYVQDLSAAYEEYASDLLKDVVNSYGGLDVVAPASVRDEDGAIYAFGNLSPGGEYALVWVRTDWLEQLGLEKPTTMDELLDVARAFRDAKPAGDKTVPIEITNTHRDVYNQHTGTSWFWQNFSASPGNWYQNENGDYVYGSVQPEARDGLEFFAQLYAEGLLDKEWATKDYTASVGAGNCGILTGPWWIGAWPLNNTKINNPDAEWEPLWIKHEDGAFHGLTPDATTENRYYLCRAGYEHPEVLIKMMNLAAEQQNLYNIEKYDTFDAVIPSDVLNHYYSIGFYRLDWGAWPLSLKIRYSDQLSRMGVVWNDLVEEVKAGKDIPAFAMESFDGKLIVDYMNGVDNSDGGMHVYTKLLALNLIKDNQPDAIMKTLYNPAPTDTMELAWTTLTDLESQVYTKIIMGEEPIEAFDQFVADWYAQGGEMITEEVNDQAKGK